MVLAADVLPVHSLKPYSRMAVDSGKTINMICFWDYPHNAKVQLPSFTDGPLHGRHHRETLHDHHSETRHGRRQNVWMRSCVRRNGVHPSNGLHPTNRSKTVQNHQ